MISPYYKTTLGTLYHGNCMDMLSFFPKQSVQLILVDLPYGQTHNEWDSVLDLQKLWTFYHDLRKPNTAIILFGQGMFSASVMLSQPTLWRYNLIWNKIDPSGHLNAKLMPLRSHEDILVFYEKLPIYNPQKTIGKKNHSIGKNTLQNPVLNNNYGDFVYQDNADIYQNLKFPKSILTFQRVPTSKALHPTQKSLDLLKYLIETYTNEGDMVLDHCSGSGTTAVACEHLKRKWICIEQEKKYCDITIQRLEREVLTICNKSLDYFFKG